jgi:hypothetical protein
MIYCHNEGGMIKWPINNELAGKGKETVLEKSEILSRNLNGET